MQDKRFYPYLFLHAGIVTLWVILDRTHKGIANDGAINLLSIAVLLCYFNLLYLHVMTSRRKATISECGWNLLSVSFIAALMYDGFSTLPVKMMERNQMTLKIFFLPKVVCCS